VLKARGKKQLKRKKTITGKTIPVVTALLSNLHRLIKKPSTLRHQSADACGSINMKDTKNQGIIIEAGEIVNNFMSIEP